MRGRSWGRGRRRKRISRTGQGGRRRRESHGRKRRVEGERKKQESVFL